MPGVIRLGPGDKIFRYNWDTGYYDIDVDLEEEETFRVEGAVDGTIFMCDSDDKRYVYYPGEGDN